MATVSVKGLSYRCRIVPYRISSGDKTSFEVSRLGIKRYRLTHQGRQALGLPWRHGVDSLTSCPDELTDGSPIASKRFLLGRWICGRVDCRWLRGDPASGAPSTTGLTVVYDWRSRGESVFFRVPPTVYRTAHRSLTTARHPVTLTNLKHNATVSHWVST